MKRNMSIILAVLLILNVILAISCSSADDDKWKENTGTIDLSSMQVSGEGISVSDNTVTITKGGDFTVTGTLEDGMIYISSEEKVKLRLNGASITNSKGPAIFFDNAQKAFITIEEGTQNYLSDAKEYSVEDADAALFSNDDLEIKGKGTLTIEGNYKHGIAGDDDISIENGNIIITSYEHGIKANDKLNITGGNITITAQTGKGLKAGKEVVIDDGALDITSLESEGIESKGTVTINGGDINIKSGDDGINTGSENSNEWFGAKKDENNQNAQDAVNGGEMPRIEGRNKQDRGNMDFDKMTPPDMQMQNGDMPPMPNDEMRDFGRMQGGMPANGEMSGMPRDGAPNMQQGEMPARGDMEGMMGGFGGRLNDEEAALRAITINGGNIYIETKGDGIDSNGLLTITGGTVTIDGPVMNGNGPLDSEGKMSITGGTVFTLSSAGMIQLPNGDGNQNILRVNFSEKVISGDVVTIKDETGKEIVSHKAVSDSYALIFSSDVLETGKKYDIYVNDTLSQSATLQDGTTSVGTAAQGMGFGGGFGSDSFGKRNNQQQNNPIKVSVDGTAVNFNVDPVVKNNTTLVGFRAIFEALGAKVDWDENTKTVTAIKGDTKIVLNIGSNTAYVNGESYQLLTAPEIINNSTMIPIRFISESLNKKVDWNEQERSITITSANK